MSSDPPVVASGTVPLTRTLAAKVEDGELEGLGPDEVSAYLKLNLRWEVVKARCPGLAYYKVDMLTQVNRLTAALSLPTKSQDSRLALSAPRWNPQQQRTNSRYGEVSPHTLISRKIWLEVYVLLI